MKRLLIKILLVLIVLLIGEPVIAAEANYDSNGVTAFYGEYDYPKDEPKENPKKTDESGGNNEPASNTSKGNSTVTTSNQIRDIPSYNGKGTILPVTGDESNLLTSFIGLLLLALVFFKIKEDENSEKISIN